MTSVIASRLLPAAPPLAVWRAAAWLVSSAAGLVLWLHYPDPRWHLGMFLFVVSGFFLHPFSSLRQPVYFRSILGVLALVFLVFVVPIAAFVLFGRSFTWPSWSQRAIKGAGLSTWLLACAQVLRRYAPHRRLQSSA